MGRFGRFVDASVIRQRMARKDARIAREVRRLSDADVIAAIRQHHLTYNIAEHKAHGCLLWDRAWVDPGGSLYGHGPYLHVPMGDCPLGTRASDGVVIRVYAPARVRRRLAERWQPKARH